MKRIILLAGKACSGKTYIGDILQKMGWKHMAFSDKLKDLVSETYNIPRHVFDTQEGKASNFTKDTTYRELLIKNAGFYRRFNDNYFVDYIRRNIILNGYDRVVISDFRFPNEYSFLNNSLPSDDYDITTVCVERSTSINMKYESEHALDKFKFDYVIINEDNTSADLISQLGCITGSLD